MSPVRARRSSKRRGCAVRALPCGLPCQTASRGVASTPQGRRVRHELAARTGLAGGRLRRSAGRTRNLERGAVGGASGHGGHGPLSREAARMPQRAASRSQTPVSNGGGVKSETLGRRFPRLAFHRCCAVRLGCPPRASHPGPPAHARITQRALTSLATP